MMKLILLNRLRLNTRDGWYVAASCALVSLLIGAFFVSRGRYEEHRARYDAKAPTRTIRLEQAEMYSNVSAGYDMPPSPLSVVSRGVTGVLGSSATVWGRFGRTEVSRLDQDFSAPAGSLLEIDVARVIAWMASFLAIFLAHDCVNGQKTRGVLTMILARPVPRSAFLLGEAAGHLLTLALPLVLAFVVCSLLIYSLRLPFESGDWARLALFCGLSLVYVTGWVLVAILLSILCKRPATSLVVGMTTWVLVTALIPNGVAWTATHMVENDSALVRLPHRDWSRQRQRPAPPLTPAERRDAERSWNDWVRQHELYRVLRGLSPASAYLQLAEGLGKSDVGAHLAFQRGVRALETTFEAWQAEKLALYPERAKSYVYGASPLDLSGLPELRYEWETLTSAAQRYTVGAGSQVVLLILLAGSAHVSFRRLDVR